MNRSKLDLGMIFKKYSHQLNNVIPEQYKVINAIQNCRTEVLGGHILSCDKCEYQRNAYNSCRNRHCPKCQFLTKVKWIENRKKDLLPCEYFHVVFTLPSGLRRLFLQNKKLCYDLLFKTSSATLKEVAKNPKNLGADIGFIGILHTWSQSLIDHPHVHYVVPAGGLNKEKNKWIKSRADYFLSVKALSKVFKAKFLSELREVYNDELLSFYGEIQDLESAHMFDHYLYDLSSKDWIVYAKKPFAGPEQVINYLGQYTHRIAISNYRLVKIEEEKVIFKVRDKKKVGESKLMSLPAKEFLRRFLLHVLPKGFVRIRHFGILGNRYKKEKIKLIRELENIYQSLVSEAELGAKELLQKIIGVDLNHCPRCNSGELIPTADIKGALNSS